MHRLLDRQIRRHLGADAAISPELKALLEAVSAAYEQTDADRALLERSLELNSQELLAQNQQLEAANRAKSAFLANMSHEIRTPLTAVIGYADLALESQQSLSDRQDCLLAIQRNAKHLVSLINDILDLSKIEADRMTIERLPVDLTQAVSEVVSLMRPRALEKGLFFQCDGIGALPKRVYTDALRLKQILVNIIGNAVKFTDRGHVKVELSCQQAANGAGGNAAGAKADRWMMIFSISDQGIGMTPEQMTRLFKPFTQADDSMTRRFGGTGLGLTICKRLAALLGGEIAVTSAPGAGSTFTISVDAGDLASEHFVDNLLEQTLPDESQDKDSDIPQVSGRILLAEDGIDNQHLISNYLRRSGATVVIAENGRLAVSRATADEGLDLILMDMQMPEMDGYAATRELRRLGYKRPIVALTAHAMAEDRGKCIDAGCDDYLTKPIDRKLLVTALAKYLPRAPRLEDSGSQRSTDQSNAVTETPPPANDNVIRSNYARDPIVKELLTKFVARLPKRVSTIEGLLRNPNSEELRRALHQLKGAAGGYGFPRLTEVAAVAEASIKSGESPDTILVKVGKLIELIRTVEGYDPQLETAESQAPAEAAAVAAA